MSDAQGHPLALCATSATSDERLQVKALLESVQTHLPTSAHPIVLEADRSYDLRDLRLYLLKCFIYPRIP